VYKLEDEGWDPSDLDKALELSMTTFHDLECTPETCRIPLGVYYREEGRPTYQDGLPQLNEPLWKRAEKPRDITEAVQALA
jgi:hypothetical protein